MQEAWESTPASQTEDRAWLLTQMSHLQLQKGNTAEARRYAKGALDLFPGYHYALGMLGRIEVATGECAKAVGFFRERYQGAPHAENLFELAEALSCSGEGKQADAAFREFETKALTESVSADNANHELVAYYLDHAHRPERALEIALAERARRHDAYTLDALARSLAAVGQYDEARKTMQAALEFGTQDPALLRHSMSIQALAEKPRNSR
jgi:Flp pilus assembly protein TadD